MCCTPPSPLSTMCPPFRNSPVGWKPPCAPTPIWWQSRQGNCWAMPTPPPSMSGQPISGPQRAPSTSARISEATAWGPSSTGPWNGCWPPKTSSTATPASPFLRQKTPPSPRPASAFTSGWGTLWWGSFIRWDINLTGGITWCGWKRPWGPYRSPGTVPSLSPDCGAGPCPAGQRYDKTFSKRRWSRGWSFLAVSPTRTAAATVPSRTP